MIVIENNGKRLEFESEPSLFSPKAVDEGTLAMLSQIDFRGEDKVLDLGCGYGVLGILAANEIGEQHVVMCDISEMAVRVAKRFIEGGYCRLRQGGQMVLVVKRLVWYQNKLTAVFGGVKVRECHGYYVLIAEKRKIKNSTKTKRKMSKKLLRKYKIGRRKK